MKYKVGDIFDRRYKDQVIYTGRITYINDDISYYEDVFY